MHPAESAKSQNAVVNRLQSVRGIAALMVCLYHSTQIFAPSASWRYGYRVLTSIFSGPGAVFTFLILSGFVLGLSLARHHAHGIRDVWPFLVRRFWRLWPAMLGTTLLYELYAWVSARYFIDYFPRERVEQPAGLLELAQNILLLKVSLNPVTWSLQVEWLFSIIVPFTFIWTLRNRGRSMALIAVFLLISHVFDPGRLHLKSIETPWCYLFMCYSGVLLAACKESLRGWYRKIPAAINYFLLLCAIGVCLLTAHFGNKWVPYTLAVVYLIGAIISNDFHRLFSFLDFRPFIWLGNVSYSFYLLNPLAMSTSILFFCMLIPKSFMALHFLVFDFLIGLTSIGLTIPLAKESYRFLEHPFLRARR